MSARKPSPYPPFHTGNVIKAPGPDGGLWVVTDCDAEDDPKGTVSAVSFEHSHVSATQSLHDREESRTCMCGDHPDFEGEPQDDCEDCKGTGTYIRKTVGWKRSKLMAECCKDFIMRRAAKLFSLD